MKEVLCKGNVIINKIKIGDVHYEYNYGLCIKSKVISEPVRDEEGLWTWQSENLTGKGIINYGQHEDYAHYGINLYDFEAYISIPIKIKPSITPDIDWDTN